MLFNHESQSYETPADLRARVVAPSSNDPAYVQSNNKLYFWDSTSTKADDGNKTIKLNSFAAGRYLSVGQESVKEYDLVASTAATVAEVLEHDVFKIVNADPKILSIPALTADDAPKSLILTTTQNYAIAMLPDGIGIKATKNNIIELLWNGERWTHNQREETITYAPVADITDTSSVFTVTPKAVQTVVFYQTTPGLSVEFSTAEFIPDTHKIIYNNGTVSFKLIGVDIEPGQKADAVLLGGSWKVFAASGSDASGGLPKNGFIPGDITLSEGIYAFNGGNSTDPISIQPDYDISSVTYTQSWAAGTTVAPAPTDEWGATPVGTLSKVRVQFNGANSSTVTAKLYNSVTERSTVLESSTASNPVDIGGGVYEYTLDAPFEITADTQLLALYSAGEIQRQAETLGYTTYYQSGDSNPASSTVNTQSAIQFVVQTGVTGTAYSGSLPASAVQGTRVVFQEVAGITTFGLNVKPAVGEKVNGVTDNTVNINTAYGQWQAVSDGTGGWSLKELAGAGGEITPGTPYAPNSYDSRVGTAVYTNEILYLDINGIVYPYIAVQDIPNLVSDYKAYGGNGDAFFGGITNALLPYGHNRYIPLGEATGSVAFLDPSVSYFKEYYDSVGNYYAVVCNNSSTGTTFGSESIPSKTFNLLKYDTIGNLIYQKQYTTTGFFDSSFRHDILRFDSQNNAYLIVPINQVANSSTIVSTVIEGVSYNKATSVSSSVTYYDGDEQVLVKYAADGNYQWQKQHGRSSPTTTADAPQNTALSNMTFSTELVGGVTKEYAYLTGNAKYYYLTSGTTSYSYRSGNAWYYGGTLIESINFGVTASAVWKIDLETGALVWKKSQDTGYYTSASNYTYYYPYHDYSENAVVVLDGDNILFSAVLDLHSSSYSSSISFFGMPSYTPKAGAEDLHLIEMSKETGAYVSHRTINAKNTAGDQVYMTKQNGYIQPDGSLVLPMQAVGIMKEDSNVIATPLAIQNPAAYSDFDTIYGYLTINKNGSYSWVTTHHDDSVSDVISYYYQYNGDRYLIVRTYASGSIIPIYESVNTIGETEYIPFEMNRLGSARSDTAVMKINSDDRVEWVRRLFYDDSDTTEYAPYLVYETNLNIDPDGYLSFSFRNDGPANMYYGDSTTFENVSSAADSYVRLKISQLSGNLIA